MQISQLLVNNYKSLRDVSFYPSPLTCVIGPNASGKSNLADSLDFLSNVYRHNLEVAIARKGGYENIAYRRMRRSKAAISFQLTISVEAVETGLINIMDVPEEAQIQFRHSFSFSTHGTGIRAEFEVESEEFEARVLDSTISPKSDLMIFKAVRQSDSTFRFRTGKTILGYLKEEIDFLKNYFAISGGPRKVPPQSLLISQVSFFMPLSQVFSREVSRTRVFRFTPEGTRLPGSPIPNPDLSLNGENLPSLVDWLKNDYKKLWKVVMSGMRDVLPGLEDISVRYLHTKSLGLFFEEAGVGRPWIADDVSDGTIQTLAILVALVDPRTSCLVIEEPENSVHPWVIRHIVKRCRDMSGSKAVILTSHSKTLIDSMRPEEIWVAHREDLESHLDRLTDLDRDIKKNWENGDFQISDALDAGLIPYAVPGGET